MRRLTKALAFAAEAHRNHRRKGASQEPYINHLIEVLDLVASVEGGDMDVLISALLHDVLEDTPTSYDALVATFGTRPPGAVAVTPTSRRTSCGRLRSLARLSLR